MQAFNHEMNRLRGWGIVLVVIGHGLFIDMLSPVEVPAAYLFSYLFSAIYSFHMPLFFFISGFFNLKALRINNQKEYILFIRQKFLQLMVPYFTLSIVASIIKTAISSYSVRPFNLSTILPTILLYPWDNPMVLLWYIYTLFFVFALVPMFNKVSLPIKIAALFVLSILPLHYGALFNLNGIIRYLLYFLLGVLFAKHYPAFLVLPGKLFISMGTFILLLLLNLFRVENELLYQPMLLVTACTGIIMSVSLVHSIQSRLVQSVLDTLGKYSLDLYVLHWFAQMPVRILYQQLHFDYHFLAVAGILIAFLVIPVSKCTLRQSPLLEGLFLGAFAKNTATPYSKKQQKKDLHPL